MRKYWFAVLALCLFSAPGWAAGTIDLSQYKGKVVYLDFWASWCSPCRQSFPFMNALQKKYEGQGLEVVGVNVDENRKDAISFLQDMPAAFNVIYDAGGKIADSYKIPGMPTTLLIDREGKVRETRIGFHPAEKDRYEDTIRKLLSEK